MILCYMILLFIFFLYGIIRRIRPKNRIPPRFQTLWLWFRPGNKEGIRIEIKLDNLWNYFYGLTIL